MKVNITTRHFDDRREARHMKGYAEKKTQRLERYMEDREPSEVKIILSSEKLRNNAEIIVKSGNMNATASIELEDMHASIDKAFDAVIKQLRRSTDKQAKSKRRAAANSKDSSKNSKNRENSNNLVERKLPAKPMSLDEALLQLNVADENYVIFRNSDTLEMNVVYREKSSKVVNLITP